LKLSYLGKSGIPKFPPTSSATEKKKEVASGYQYFLEKREMGDSFENRTQACAD
jgi:hypothetical protein